MKRNSQPILLLRLFLDAFFLSLIKILYYSLQIELIGTAGGITHSMTSSMQLNYWQIVKSFEVVSSDKFQDFKVPVSKVTNDFCH